MIPQPLSTRAKVHAFICSVRGGLSRVASSRWSRPLARASGVLVALVVLAAIGRSTFAHPAVSSVVVTPPDPITPTALAAAPPPSVTPATTPATSVAGPPTVPVESLPLAAHRGVATPDDPVILNSATVDDLERLPHVGPKRAEAILALRTHLGRFRQVDDLMRVKGIGRATLKKIRPLVRLDAPPPPTPPPTPSASSGGSSADRGA
jgi:competence protein ComEA